MSLFKIAYSGTHGTGKTTAVYKRAHEEKLNCKDLRVRVLAETTEGCPFPINEAATPLSQWWMFLAHMKREVEAEAKDGILICDRTIIDPIAYSMVHGFMDDAAIMLGVAGPYMATYQEIIVRTAENNPYQFADGVRSVEKNFRADVDKAMIDLYKQIQIYHNGKLNIIYQ